MWWYLGVDLQELIMSWGWSTHDGIAAAAAKSLQSCPTLCDPIDGSPPGSPIPGILQVKTLEWVAISFSNAWKRKVKVKSLSRVRLLATPWTAAYQAPPSMGFARQEYWSGVPLPSLIYISTYSLSLIWLLLLSFCWDLCMLKCINISCTFLVTGYIHATLTPIISLIFWSLLKVPLWHF